MTTDGKLFAFYGRVSTEDQQDPDSSRGWQLRRSRELIESHGGAVVAEFFDVGQSRSVPWKRRPEAARLLELFGDPGRGFDAVVIGEPQRAFYGAQYALTFPLFEHYDVELWVPEVGGPVDPGSEAHDLVMTLFGGMSKGERSRIRTFAERLTRDGVPSPSAYDRARNPHRTASAWSKSAVRAILTNPRYTGVGVWGRQRRDAVRIRDLWPMERRGHVDPLTPRRTAAADQHRAVRGGARTESGQWPAGSRANGAANQSSLPPPRFAALRALPSSDAGNLEPRSSPLPVPLPRGVRTH
jgi:hypothetical protein